MAHRREPRWLRNPRSQVALWSTLGLGWLASVTHLVPSAGWQRGRYAAALVMAFVSAAFYFRRFPANGVFAYGAKPAIRKIAGMVTVFVICAACSWMLAGSILPGAWTYAFGEQVATPAYLHTRDRGIQKRRSLLCRFSVAGGELGKQILSDDICLTEEHFRELPSSGEMLIEGRRSAFGTFVTDVSVKKLVETP